MKRLACWLFGHPDSYLVWGAWTQDRSGPTYRVVLERCVRCERFLHRSTLTLDEVFRP